MRTKKLNVRKEQYEWLKLHEKADQIVYKDGEAIEAIYTAPIKRWEGLIDPNGEVDVPDMDYYNKVDDPKEINKFLKEMKNL